MNIERRVEVQSEAVESIRRNNWTGIIFVAPRVGKTKIGLDSIEGSKATIYISSPFDVVRKNWEDEHKIWGCTSNIVSICHRSLHTIPEGAELLIVDEVHTMSDNQIATVRAKKPKRILVMSGSLSEKTLRNLFYSFNLNVIYEYSVESAIADGIISDFKVHWFSLPMDDVHKYWREKQYKLTERNIYEYYTGEFEKFKAMQYDKPEYEDIKMNFSRKRQRLIYSVHSKLNLAAHILNEPLVDERCLIFTGYIKSAQYLGLKSFTEAHHSKNKKEDNLTKFQLGKIDRMAVINMVNMGITFPNLKTAFIQQVQSNPEMSVQRILRVCNLETDTERTANIILTTCKDTVDEQWGESSLVDLPPNKVIRYTESTQEEICKRIGNIFGR